MARLQGISFSFLMACRFITMLFIATTVLQFISISAADRNVSTGVSGTQTDYYLRGKMNSATEEGRQAPLQHGLFLQGRQLSEEMSSEADFVEVADYSPPCANTKHDPSVCKHN